MMNILEINNFVNEDDFINHEYNGKPSKTLSKMDRKKILRSLVSLLNSELNRNSGNPKNAINNRLNSRTETLNLLNTLKSSENYNHFEEKDEEWKTPLIEDFLPPIESDEESDERSSSTVNHWNNSELNYYNKRSIENQL